MNTPIMFDEEVDVLIVGSGNGAMTSALACHDLAQADVLIVEKSSKFGGTSALSGGGIWVPNNRYAKAAGADDSYEEALAYLSNSIPEGLVKPSMIEAYLKTAPEMVDYIHDNTRLKYSSLEIYPDYFSNLPGAKIGHRSLEPKPVSFSALKGDTENMLDGGVMYILDKYAVTQKEAEALVSKRKGWKMLFFKLVLRSQVDILWRLKGKDVSRRTTGGAAGIINLFLSLKDRKIPLWLTTCFDELILDEGKVIGAVVTKEGKRLRIKANKGVVLAAGGFEHNQQMREQYLPKPTSTQWSAGCKTNTGDAIRAGINVGAKVGLMDNAWWCTTKVMPDRRYPFLSIVNKSLPGSIVVNAAGKRFSNESQNYMSFIKETFAAHTTENPCAPMYMIFDERFRRKRRVWPIFMPAMMIPQSYYDSRILGKAETLSELAEHMGIDAEGLQASVERFNQFAETGKDLDFHRGDAAYDRYYGDSENLPNPCLAKILLPPFNAIRLDAGDFGTQGGMVITEHAQVVNNDGEVIEGLYACGNCTAAILPTYPGPGSTLGPAMTFGYLAAKHIASKNLGASKR